MLLVAGRFALWLSILPYLETVLEFWQPVAF